MRDHGTCSGCGAETDPDDYCCAECSDAHDEAVREEERNAIAAEVARAVAEEREACARLVETVNALGPGRNIVVAKSNAEIAAAIRARGTKEASNG